MRKPEPPGSAARCARAVGRTAEHADELERVAQSERNALEHRTDEGPAVVTKLEPGEGGPGRRVGVRRPFAREVRARRGALPRRAPTPRPRRRDRRTRFPGASRSRSHCSDPAAESITPIACHWPGTAWQNAWTRARGSDANAGSAAKTTPEVPITIDSGPGAVDADPERPRRRSLPHRRRPESPSPRPSDAIVTPATSGDS